MLFDVYDESYCIFSCNLFIRPVALTSAVMKCFERLVLHHLKSCLPQNFDQHQFASMECRSTADSISTSLPTAASHGEKLCSYVRTLFVDCSLALNTILSKIQNSKLTDVDVPPLKCNWIRSFLMDRPQTVRIGPHTSSAWTLITGSLADREEVRDS